MNTFDVHKALAVAITPSTTAVGHWTCFIIEGNKRFHIFSKRINLSKSNYDVHYLIVSISTVCVSVHLQGYCCDGKQRSQVLWVALMGRTFNPNLCSSGRASGQGQCGLGSDGHVVNRAATYLPITGPSLEDRTRICNIHSQQANKMCVCV